MISGSLVTLALFVIILVLVAALVLLVGTRGAAAKRSADDPAPSRLLRTDLVPASGERALAADDLILVPLPNRQGDALLLGNDEALGVLDASGLLARPSLDAPGQLPQLIRSAMATGGAAATGRAQQGIDSGRIVALSEETMRHLETGKPVYDKAKNMLGLVKGDKGKFKHVMRLDQKGAQAVVASNAATLAMTAAVSQQLAAIEEKLAEISETLEQMVRDRDAERLAEVVATNMALLQIAQSVRRRGMTETDATKLAALDLPVISHQLEAEFKFADLLGDDPEDLNRAERVDRLEHLAQRERLDYWLAVRVQTDLAHTRLDLLNMQWEITQHPETAAEVTEQVRRAIETRQERLFAIGCALRELTDPESRTALDGLRQISRRRLSKQNVTMTKLLAGHGEVFVAPADHPYAVVERGHEDP